MVKPISPLSSTTSTNPIIDTNRSPPLPSKMPVSSLSYGNFRSESSTTTSGGASSGSSGGQHSPSSYSPKEADASEQAILSSPVFCIHHKLGCEWTDELRKLKAHLNMCRHDAVQCPSKCGAMIPRLLLEDHLRFTCNLRRTTCSFCNKVFTGEELENHHGSCGWEPVYCEQKCGQKVQRKGMSQHLQLECHKRLVPCSFCKKEFVFDTLTLHHQSKCPRFPITCPNRCGSPSIPRDEIEQHLKEKCSGIMVPCIFSTVGCKFKGQRGPILDAHMDDSQSNQNHLGLMCSLVSKQQAQISCLRTALSKLTVNNSGTLIWKISDFVLKLREAKSKEGVELISSAFYTSQYGYKLQASVFLNGNGVGENSHLSVYIKILPGDWDPILKWPFSHAVSFTMFDQNPTGEKTLNVVESFNPDPTWKNFQRPSREPDSLGFGFPRFISHETLMKRSYIRDDTIFIRIKVEQGKIVPI